MGAHSSVIHGAQKPRTAERARPLVSGWHEVTVGAVEPIRAAVGVSPAHVRLSERKAPDAEGV